MADVSITTGRRESQPQDQSGQQIIFCGIWGVTKLHFTMFFVINQNNLKMTLVLHVAMKPIMKDTIVS